jgi:hypothetical protein
MAEIKVLVDDLDGSRGAKTVRFSLDGVLYEIDLTLANAARMRSRLAEFVKAARPIRGHKIAARITASNGTRLNRRNKDRPPGRPDRRLTSDEAHAVRDWAAKQGIDLNDRGRIPEYIVNAYYSERAGSG